MVKIRTYQRPLFALVVLIFSVQLAQSQQIDMEQFRAAQLAGIQEWAGIRSDYSERLQNVTGPILGANCNCDKAVDGCNATTDLVTAPESDTTTMTISLKDNLKKKQCARVSSFITTQWNIDNSTPHYEETTIIRETPYQEILDHDRWNQRAPILLPEEDGTCHLCPAPSDAYCPPSNKLLNELNTELANLKSHIQEAQSAHKALKMAASALGANGPEMVSLFEQSLDAMSLTESSLMDNTDQLRRSRAEWCN